MENRFFSMGQKLERLETMVTAIFKKQTVKDWYTTDEFAELVGKAEFTVREWCRLGSRLNQDQLQVAIRGVE